MNSRPDIYFNFSTNAGLYGNPSTLTYTGMESGIATPQMDSTFNFTSPVKTIDPEPQEEYSPFQIVGVRRSLGELLGAFEGNSIFQNPEMTGRMRVLNYNARREVIGGGKWVVLSADITSAQRPGFYNRKSTLNSKKNRGVSGRASLTPVKGKNQYKVYIRVNNNNEIPINGMMPCEVRCECPAFQYWLAHPDWKVKNLYNNPSAANLQEYTSKTGRRVRNPDMIPGMCKHIAFFLYQLTSEGRFIRH